MQERKMLSANGVRTVSYEGGYVPHCCLEPRLVLETVHSVTTGVELVADV